MPNQNRPNKNSPNRSWLRQLLKKMPTAWILPLLILIQLRRQNRMLQKQPRLRLSSRPLRRSWTSPHQPVRWG
jgi:hypothetical protein